MSTYRVRSAGMGNGEWKNADTGRELKYLVNSLMDHLKHSWTHPKALLITYHMRLKYAESWEGDLAWTLRPFQCLRAIKKVRICLGDVTYVAAAPPQAQVQQKLEDGYLSQLAATMEGSSPITTPAPLVSKWRSLCKWLEMLCGDPEADTTTSARGNGEPRSGSLDCLRCRQPCWVQGASGNSWSPL